jgi:putative transposase
MQETASSGEFRIDIAMRHLVTQTVGIKIVRHRPKAVLAYLSRYTHRVAISGRRLISLDETGVTFRDKDHRRDGAERYRTMTLATDEFIRRFLLRVLPKGFRRSRHCGLLRSADRKANVARDRALFTVP